MEADMEADAGTDKRRNGSGGSRYRKMSVYPAHLSEVKPEKTLNFKEKAPDCIRKVTYMGETKKPQHRRCCGMVQVFADKECR